MSAFLALFLTFGCADQDQHWAEDEALKERWNYNNDPANFRGIELTYAFDKLPDMGKADREVWPSTYWATYKDSINARWHSKRVGDEYKKEFSPAEKYDQVFHGWEPTSEFMAMKPYVNGNACKDFDKEYYDNLGPLASHISNHMGNARARNGVDDDGDGNIDECDDRDGVETWFGLCHAWAPAAMLEDRPMYPIRVKGVTFLPGDIEALIIATYNRPPADMIGGRCNDKEVKRDDNGRIEDVACRDTNPGTLHVVMGNYLGLNGRSFVEDRTYNYEVWNQPIVEYEVTKMDEITAKEANEALGLEGDKYEYNLDAKIFYKVKAKVVYLAESDANVEPIDITRFHRTDRYDYILELDGERNIIGGEWIGNSRTSHPDFLWSPYQVQRSPVPFLDIKEVRELIRLSRLVDPAARGMQDPEFVYPEPPAPVEEPVEEPVTESPEPGTDTDTDTDTPAPEPTDVD